MTKQRPRPRVGDAAWLVEWCCKLAFYDDDPSGDVDRDNCTMANRLVSSREKAIQLAREVWPLTTRTFGIVEYWPVTFVPYDEDDAECYPHVGFWEATDEGEVYEGEATQ